MIGSAWITHNDTANASSIADAGGLSTVEGTAVTLVGAVSDDKPGVTARRNLRCLAHVGIRRPDCTVLIVYRSETRSRA